MKVGFASCDWSRSVYDASGHPVMGGAGWARLGQYSKHIDSVKAIGVLAHNEQKQIFGVRTWDNTDHFDLDVIVMQRVMFEDVADKIKIARAHGQIIINDLDDWYWGLSTSNHAWKASHPKYNPTENINHYKSILAASNYVTVSTPYLAQRISSWVKSPIEVLPNTVDLNRFAKREVTDTEIPIVGWVGSTAHRSNDLEQMRGVLSPMWSEGKILLHHSGYLKGHPLFADAIGVHPRLISTLPLVAPEDYPSVFQFDVGIVPLSDVPFNQAKSAIKGLEYAAAGIPFVASPLDEYRLLAEQGIGVVAKKSRHWRPILESLRDPKFRKELSEQATEAIVLHDIGVGVERLKSFLESVKS
jgi:hypothetical protein